MSNLVFAISLVVGAALLALWLDVRFPRQGLTLQRIVGHAIVALLLVHLAPGGSASPALSLAIVFALVLPALVYLWLTAVWFVRLAQGALGSSVG
ncbi:MAG TPA: hypothetical protein VNT58_01325 [Gaiellaceae bacterium]|nr:hypothetical protein [Gaiellaceae bacterium]